MNLDTKKLSIPAFGLLVLLGGYGVQQTIAQGKQIVQVDQRQQVLEDRFDEYIKKRESSDAKQETYNSTVSEVLDRLTRPTPTPN